MRTLEEVSPQQLADDAVREILRSQWNHERAIRLDSPPGAGKTGVVERLAVQSLGVMGERCMIATQTNEQAFDVARRLARGFSQLEFHLFVRDGLVLPDELLAKGNLSIVRSGRHLPAGPCVVIANAAKWSWVQDGIVPFDLQVVDEAFQLADHRFHQIAGLADRVVLIGDPGQISPVVKCETERWSTDPSGPQVPSPMALTARHPWIRRMELPVSRRLVPDTVSLVQPAFYPELPFRALSQAGDRSLAMRSTSTSTWVDGALSEVESGASIVQIELPTAVTGQVDEGVADAIVASICRLFERDARILNEGFKDSLTPEMVGVVCAHVSQVSAIRERLGPQLSGVLVETADRFQGLERAIVFVYHPLSGRTDASEFHLDAGRLCVMLSRHRIACIVVARQGMEEMLSLYAPLGNRILGIDDSEFAGWSAHTKVLQELRLRDRIISTDKPA